MTPVTRSCNPDQVYPVREDTLLLLDAARMEVQSSDRILEVGTGSGHIAVELGAISREVVATDINPHAVSMAKGKGVEVIRTDLVSGLCGTFDLIVFNPPYLPTREEERVEDWLERALDGGVSGREVIERFLQETPRILASGGRILLLLSTLTGVENVLDLASKLGFTGQIMQSIAIEGEDLLVIRLTRRIPNKSL